MSGDGADTESGDIAAAKSLTSLATAHSTAVMIIAVGGAVDT